MKTVALCALLIFSPPSKAEDVISPVLRATEIAMRDFSRQIQERDRYPPVLAFMADIRNYNVGLSENDRFFVVVLLPRTVGKVSPNGGGAEYWIEKRNFKIIKMMGYR